MNAVAPIGAEVLRLAAALAHVVPDAQLRLDHDDGTTIRVGHTVEDQLTPCQLRQAVLADEEEVLAASLSSLELRGSLVPSGGGLFTRWDHCGRLQCWFATTLCPTDLRSALHGCQLPVDPALVAVCIKPDPGLRVCCVCLALQAAAADDGQLVAIGATADAACAVAELVAVTRR
jgi:hypothetical protein